MFKQNFIYQEIKLKFPDIVNNKQIDGGCSRKRPDGFLDLLTHSIIIEYDENQHVNYSCENKRMMEIFNDLGDRPVVFIRFNPDEYIDEHGDDIDGCFSFDDKNKLLVNSEEWGIRLEMLINTITNAYQLPDKEITIYRLFYNEQNDDSI
jgi:hypothetical protein